MSPAATPLEVHREVGSVQLIRGDVQNKFVDIEMLLANVTSCSDTDVLHVSDTTVSCPVVTKCGLVSDRVGENICTWRCLCDGHLLCNVKFFQGDTAYSWELCDLSSV